MKLLLAALALAAVSNSGAPAGPGEIDAIAAAASITSPAAATPTFSPPPSLPPDARPPGEREPVIGLLAVFSIVIAAGAGWYVYRVIRKGL